MEQNKVGKELELNPWKIQHARLLQPQHRSQIGVLTCGPLTYIRTLKCASSFFYSSFESMGWKSIPFDDIDWVNSRVFSHMLDPIERRHKGVAEFLMMNGAQNLFYESQVFRSVIATVPFLDQHSMGYHNLYGNYCYQIDWIPISGFTSDVTCEFTEKLLWQYGVKILGRWQHDRARPASDELKQLQKDVKLLCESNYQNEMSWYFWQDLQLYYRVSERFNPRGIDWPNISWLRLQ